MVTQKYLKYRSVDKPPHIEVIKAALMLYGFFLPKCYGVAFRQDGQYVKHQLN